MRSLILGLDVSPKRLGWGYVDLVTGEAAGCGCEAIDLPEHGWHHKRVSGALADIWWHGAPDGDCEVQAVYIEQPWLSPRSGTKSAYSAGRAVSAAQGACERRWPHAPIAFLHPQEWRKLAGIANKGKEPIVLRALELGFGREVPGDQSRVLEWVVPGGQDAADAACIARAGWVRNEEIMEAAA